MTENEAATTAAQLLCDIAQSYPGIMEHALMQADLSNEAFRETVHTLDPEAELVWD